MPHRRRLWMALAALAFALTLQIGFWRAAAMPEPASTPATSAPPQAVDWGRPEAPAASPPLRQPTLPPLQLGAYITNVNDIDLLNDQFSIELLLWTIWPMRFSSVLSGRSRMVLISSCWRS